MGKFPIYSNSFQEIDDDLDKLVSKDEFEKMYKRCISDIIGLEPRKLYNLVERVEQFE